MAKKKKVTVRWVIAVDLYVDPAATLSEAMLDVESKFTSSNERRVTVDDWETLDWDPVPDDKEPA